MRSESRCFPAPQASPCFALWPESVILKACLQAEIFSEIRSAVLFQPNRRHRAKTHGFLTRMKTKAGAAVLSRRRAKGRKRVSVSAGYRD
jgi:large subunit ribosomal protein L34